MSNKKGAGNKEVLKSPTENKTMKNKIIQVLKSSAADSTTHGIDHAFKRDNKCIRAFWLLSFIASGCVCGYIIALSTMDYLGYDTLTKAERVHQVSTDYPTISICNLNQFTTSDSYEYVRDLLVANNIVNPMAPEFTFNFLFADNLLLFRYFAGTNIMDPQNNNTLRKFMGYNISEMLLSCTYNLNTCSANDFDWFYDVYYGNCFTFNNGKYGNGSSGEILKSTKAGVLNGLTIELFLNEPTNVMSLTSSTGARVIVHNRTFKPMFTEGISVPTGAQTNIEVHRKFSYHLPKPYSECSSDINPNHPSTLVRVILATNYSYTQQICFLVCYRRYLVRECGCFDTSFNLPQDSLSKEPVGPCILFNQTICNANYFSFFFSGYVKVACGSECPRECESVSYRLFTSQSEYPTEVYANSLMSNPVIQSKYASNPSQLSYDSLKRSLVQISVYYGDLGFQKFEELEKTSLGDLIAGIGGTLGLFLGMSVLSFMEIVDVLLQIIFLKSSSKNVIFPEI